MAEPRRAEIESMRIQRGWKRSDLGKRVGKSYKHIWGIERGTHSAAVETLQLIANAFGVPLDQVMADDDARGAA